MNSTANTVGTRLAIYTTPHKEAWILPRHLLGMDAGPFDDRVSRGRFDRLEELKDCCVLASSLDDCQLALLPFDYSQVLNGAIKKCEALKFIQDARSANRETLVFCWHDSSEPLELGASALIVRTAAEGAAAVEPFFEVLPAWPEDIVQQYCAGSLNVRPYATTPTIGFCGRSYSIVRSRRERLKATAHHWIGALRKREMTVDYKALRADAMMHLQNDVRVRTNFIAKPGFYGRIEESARPVSIDEKLRARSEFINNLLNSDYSLTIRGAGNFSIRFYEALCAGRPLLYIDSGGALPFAQEVQYDRVLCRVQQRDSSALASRLQSFHLRLGPDGYAEIQKDCREIWETYLSPHGFFRKLISKIDRYLGRNQR